VEYAWGVRRWIVVLALAHIAGSYGVEAWDMVQNYGMEVGVLDRVEAPLRVGPFLVRETFRILDRRAARQLFWFWVSYAVPVTIVVCIVPRFLRQRPPRWGAALLTTGVAAMSNALCLPLWILTFPATLIFGAWLISSYLDKRAARKAIEARGRCSKCGYDLRATPDRCPECGTAVGG
jgi:hypothetical protein